MNIPDPMPATNLYLYPWDLRDESARAVTNRVVSDQFEPVYARTVKLPLIQRKERATQRGRRRGSA